MDKYEKCYSGSSNLTLQKVPEGGKGFYGCFPGSEKKMDGKKWIWIFQVSKN